MNQQKDSKLVQYWADNHLVVFGNQYQLINRKTQKILFKRTTKSYLKACKKYRAFLRHGNTKQFNKLKPYKDTSNLTSLSFITSVKSDRKEPEQELYGLIIEFFSQFDNTSYKQLMEKLSSGLKEVA